jgi:hypothetical protein
MLQCSHLGGLRIEVSTHGAASAWGGRNDGAVVFAPGHAAVVTSKSFGACLNEWTSGYHASDRTVHAHGGDGMEGQK